MKRILNGEVFLVLFLLSGFYKPMFMSVIPLDPTAIFFVLSLAAALSRIYKRPIIYKDVVVPIILYFSIASLMLASLFFNAGNAYAYDKTFSFIFITGWSFVGVFLLTDLKNPKRSLNRYIATFLSVGIIMVGASFISEDEGNFISSFGSNYLALGKMSAIAGLILIIFIINRKIKIINSIILLAVIAICVYVLLSTGGRMPVIAFAACLAIILVSGIKITNFSFKNVKIKKKTLLYGALALAISPLIFNLLSSAGNLFYLRLMLIFNGGGDSVIARSEHWEISTRAFADTNMLGLGAGGYLPYTGVAGSRAYPHNIFLESMSELGLLGLLLITSLLILAMIRYFAHNKVRNFYSLTIFILFLYSLLNALTSGDLNDNRMLFFFAAILLLSRIIFNDKYEKAAI